MSEDILYMNFKTSRRRGVPKGGILSSILIIINVNDIGETTPSIGV